MTGKYVNLRESLQDKESKVIFDARIEYMATKDEFRLGKTMLELYGKFQYSELDEFLEGRDKQMPLVICGAGKEGERTLDILKHTGNAQNVYGFFDNNDQIWGETRYGLLVYSIYDLLLEKRDMVFIVASQKYGASFQRQLLNLRIPQNNIFVAPYNVLYAQRGKQYFDLFESVEHEVFVDAGAFDGLTSMEFLKWCHGKYDGIYMFELNSNMKRICLSNVGGTEHRIHFIEKGCWSKDGILAFYDAQSSSRIVGDAQISSKYISVPVCSIDSELKGAAPTFIKMDIEGAEMEALRGAVKTIKSFRPRLAISVYHKPEDMTEIMEYLLQINPDYKFYLRHYSSCCWETVLYAL